MAFGLDSVKVATETAYGNAMGTSTVCRRSVIEFSGGNGAPRGDSNSRPPDIRSLVPSTSTENKPEIQSGTVFPGPFQGPPT